MGGCVSICVPAAWPRVSLFSWEPTANAGLPHLTPLSHSLALGDLGSDAPCLISMGIISSSAVVNCSSDGRKTKAKTVTKKTQCKYDVSPVKPKALNLDILWVICCLCAPEVFESTLQDTRKIHLCTHGTHALCFHLPLRLPQSSPWALGIILLFPFPSHKAIDPVLREILFYYVLVCALPFKNLPFLFPSMVVLSHSVRYCILRQPNRKIQIVLNSEQICYLSSSSKPGAGLLRTVGLKR